jgi:membrane protease YdiL (CAAX protease family)
MTEPALAVPSPMVAPPRARPTAAEMCIVFGCTVGVMGLGSIWPGQSWDAIVFTNVELVGVVAFEVLVAALLVPWLRRRGWSPRAVAGLPRVMDIARGVGVAALAYSCYIATWVLFSRLQPELARALGAMSSPAAVPLSMTLVVIASLVNPVFEEFLWLGYGVGRIAPLIGVRVASALSVVLRLSVHLYQGPWALLAILPLGVAFTWYYGRTRRLWPVIVAHALFDLIPFLRLAQ